MKQFSQHIRLPFSSQEISGEPCRSRLELCKYSGDIEV